MHQQRNVKVSKVQPPIITAVRISTLKLRSLMSSRPYGIFHFKYSLAAIGKTLYFYLILNKEFSVEENESTNNKISLTKNLYGEIIPYLGLSASLLFSLYFRQQPLLANKIRSLFSVAARASENARPATTQPLINRLIKRSVPLFLEMPSLTEMHSEKEER